MSDEELAAPAAETTAPVEPAQSTEQASTVAETTAEPAETPETAATSDDASDPKPKKTGGGFQKRISELTREKYELALELQAIKQREQAKKAPAAPKPTGDGPPSIDQFSTVEEYTKAVIEYGKKQGQEEAKTAAEQAKKEAEENEVQAEANRRNAQLRARTDMTREKFPDFNQYLQPLLPAIQGSEALQTYLYESEAATETLYRLAKEQPAKIGELLRMSPFSALRELTRLEDKLSAPAPLKPTTKAPDPIKPVSAADAAPPSLAKLAETDMAAYVKRRKQMGA